MYMIYTVAWYNMLVYSEYMSWYDTFGLHTGPLSVCLELALLERYSEKYSAWATAAESTGQRSCTLDFNMVAEQWSLDDTGQGELQYTSATKLQH